MVLALAMSYLPAAETGAGDPIQIGHGMVDKLYHFEYDGPTARGARAESRRPHGRRNPLNLTRIMPA